MNRRKLSRRDVRALRLGALVVGPLLLIVLVVRPYVGTLSGLQNRLDAERRVLAREAALLAAADEYRPATETARHALEAGALRMFAAEDAPIAVADLVAHVRQAARDSRVFVREIGNASLDTLGGGLVAIRVELLAESDFEGTLDLLRRFEAGMKLIRVDRLRIEAVRDDSTEPAQGYDALAVRLELTGYTARMEIGRGSGPAIRLRRASVRGPVESVADGDGSGIAQPRASGSREDG